MEPSVLDPTNSDFQRSSASIAQELLTRSSKKDVSKKSSPDIRQLLARLNSIEQAALKLVFFDGLSHTAAAQELQIPLKSVKNLVRAGLMKISARKFPIET